jgi:predicted ribosome quality control (RQC) complex YloA/Tae2 family protein
MDFQLLSSVIDELSHLLTGARVMRVFEGAGKALIVSLNRDRKQYILMLSPDRSMPRLHLVKKKPAAVVAPHGFTLYLRSHAQGARITRVSLLNRDRVVELRFSRQETEYRLVFELLGSSANIIIADAALKILAVYYPVPPGDRVKRPLVPGFQYEPPAKKQSQFTDAMPAVSSLLDGAANREAELLFERMIDERNVAALRSELGTLVHKRLAKTGKKIKALSADLEAAQQAEQYRQAGDLILANLRRISAGTEEAALTGYDGISINVRLDPKRSPAGNAELYFKKYKKAKAGRDIILERLQQTRDEDSRLRTFLEMLEQAGELDALSHVRSELEANGYLRERGKGKVKKRNQSQSASYRKIEYRGWDILVGKSAAGNDYLTTKIARPNDLWLHAEGLPGSHVLVKNPGAKDIPPDVFSKAASLAAFHSKGKNSGKVPVTYTLAGQVRKPKGAKPGLVTLRERKTIVVVPEEG